MLLSLKCNVQILGSISLLNFLAACLEKTSHFLRSTDFTGKRKYSRSGLFLIPFQEQATAQYLFTWKKTAKNRKIRGDFLSSWQKHMGLPTMFVLIFRAVFPGASLRRVGFYTSLALKYIEIGWCGDRVFLTGGNP